jgi:hypothetical protein
MTTDILTPTQIATGQRGRSKRFPSVLHRQCFQWRIRRALECGAATEAQIAAQYGYTPRMVRYIRFTAQQPDLHGLDEATALAASVAGVPVKTAAYLLATYATTPAADQAEALRLTINGVWTYRKRLLAAGLLKSEDGLWGKEIARKQGEHDRMARLLRQGLTLAEVAEACECSEWYVRESVLPCGGVEALQAEARCYSLDEASRVLGIPEHTILSCVRLGLLHAPRRERWHRRGRKPKQHGPTRYAIRRSDICEFLRNRLAWPRFSLATIADPELKRYAQLQQQAAGGMWRTQGEMARLAGITRSTATEWRKLGWLADWETTTFGQTTFYWHANGRDVPTMKAKY